MTRSSLDTEIDQLYQLPLADFTAARNALAKTVKGPDAKQIKQLGKPTAVPWTVNQLYWRARPTYNKLIAAGHALREAQIAALKGRGADVRGATEAHRAVVGEAVREGTAIAAREAANPPADQLARMLEALSLAGTPPAAPGRFTELVQPSGFEALAGITPVGGPAPPPPVPAPPAAPAAVRRGREDAPGRPGPRLVTTPPVVREDPVAARRRAAEERRRAAEEERRRKEAERAAAKAAAAAREIALAKVRTAERELARAREEYERAERALKDAGRSVEQAEQKLAAARADRVLSSPDV